jgi:hypothetical protein
MPAFKNLAGQRFGRLTVVGDVGRTGRGYVRWLSLCDCGIETIVRADRLRSSETQSCGCLQRERVAISAAMVGKANRTHGHARYGKMTPTYSSWRAAMSRCTNPNDAFFEYYGGSGVTVCERWTRFENFLADMGERPEGTTLGRILDMGDYEPGNAFWMTASEQRLNQLNKRHLPVPTQTLLQAV